MADTDGSIGFRPVGGADNVANHFPLFRRRSAAEFVTLTCGSIDCMPPDSLLGLDTLDRWVGRRDIGMFSLSLDICLLQRWGLMVVLSVDCDISRAMLFFRRGFNFFQAAFETVDESTGLRIERTLGRFPL